MHVNFFFIFFFYLSINSILYKYTNTKEASLDLQIAKTNNIMRTNNIEINQSQIDAFIKLSYYAYYDGFQRYNLL